MRTAKQLYEGRKSGNSFAHTKFGEVRTFMEVGRIGDDTEDWIFISIEDFEDIPKHNDEFVNKELAFILSIGKQNDAMYFIFYGDFGRE